jgi:hypothetical protein
VDVVTKARKKLRGESARVKGVPFIVDGKEAQPFADMPKTTKRLCPLLTCPRA